MRSWFRLKVFIDLSIICIGLFIVYILDTRYDIFEMFLRYIQKHETWELDELITISIYLVLSFVFFSLRRWQDSARSERELKRNLDKLEKANEEIKQMKGILPICSYCKKIRDDEGYWHQVEVYIHEHSEAEFAHSLCPKCRKTIYEDELGNL
jgi:hypothetical protein